MRSGHNLGPRVAFTPAKSAPVIAGWFKRLATAIERADHRGLDQAKRELQKLGWSVQRNFDGGNAAPE